MSVCDLWSVAEPSQNKRKKARILINRSVNNTIDGYVNEWVIYLSGEQLSINAHQREILLATSSQ